ncbi:MAG: hypothetical protein ABL904_16730, partial [Hyphomicrobiaceae bacterium]
MKSNFTAALPVAKAMASLARLAAVAALALAVNGCGVSTLTSGIGGGIFGGSGSKSAEAKGVSEDQLLLAAKS